jgi:hypothetical protein
MSNIQILQVPLLPFRLSANWLSLHFLIFPDNRAKRGNFHAGDFLRSAIETHSIALSDIVGLESNDAHTLVHSSVRSTKDLWAIFLKL